MKCYGFAVFWNFRILKVVLGYKKWSKTAENEDSQRKIVELSNDMSDVFLAFLEMKCDTRYHGLHNHGDLVDSCEGSPLKGGGICKKSGSERHLRRAFSFAFSNCIIFAQIYW